jgi:hypothetical protein
VLPKGVNRCSAIGATVLAGNILKTKNVPKNVNVRTGRQTDRKRDRQSNNETDKRQRFVKERTKR